MELSVLVEKSMKNMMLFHKNGGFGGEVEENDVIPQKRLF